MNKQIKSKQYDTTFKIKAILLSDGIGVKKAAAESGVPYHTLAYWRHSRDRYGEQTWSAKYLEKRSRKIKAKICTHEERKRFAERLLHMINCGPAVKAHELVVDITINRAPELYKAPDFTTDDALADYKEGDFLYNALDHKDAKAFLLRAAHAGIPAAQYELGSLYYYGTYEDEAIIDLNMAEVWMIEILKNTTANNKILRAAEEMLKMIRKGKRKIPCSAQC